MKTWPYFVTYSLAEKQIFFFHFKPKFEIHFFVPCGLILKNQDTTYYIIEKMKNKDNRQICLKDFNIHSKNRKRKRTKDAPKQRAHQK